MDASLLTTARAVRKFALRGQLGDEYCVSIDPFWSCGLSSRDVVLGVLHGSRERDSRWRCWNVSCSQQFVREYHS